MEKLLGVKVFFEQYNTKERGMVPSLLVTNVPLDMLVNSANVDRLKTYLNTVNNKNDYANTIWLGIVPNVELDQSKTKKVARQRFRGNVVAEKADGNTMESLTTLMDVVKDYKIQTFFNFETGERTTFNAVATSGVETFIEKSRSLVKKDFSEYVSCCLPNFTIVPKELVAYTEEGKAVALNRLWNRRQSTKFNGTPYIVQRAAEAVYSPEGRAQIMANIAYYRENAQLMKQTFESIGIPAFGGVNSPYVWIKTPLDSWQFFDRLLNECHVVGTPGVGFGPSGQGYFRLTAFATHEATREAMERIKRWKL